MLALLATAVLLPAAPPPPPIARASASTAVGVSAREFRLVAYRSSVPRGRVTFNVHNYGEDAHNLEITGPGGYRSKVTPDILSDENGRLAVTLKRRGTYSLLCVKPGHLAKGMRSSIKVR